MFRTTPMPAAGLSVLAGDLAKGDRIVLEDFGDEVLVVGVDRAADHVFLTVSDGDRRVDTLRYHRLIPMQLAYPVRRSEPTWRQVLRRGLPWWGFALLVGLLGLVLGMPPTGGTLLIIVVCWLVGALSMLTTSAEPVR